MTTTKTLSIGPPMEINGWNQSSIYSGPTHMDGPSVAQVYRGGEDGRDGSPEAVAAQAALFAAAPDMLRALKIARFILAGVALEEEGKPLQGIFDSDRALIATAIAKAEGL